MRKFIIIVVVFVGIIFASRADAACVLNNASWGGPVEVGQSIRVLVSGTGCQGFTVAINIYKDTAINFFIKSAQITFQSDTQATGQVTITQKDFEGVYAGPTTIDIFFKANAGGSEIESNNISLTGKAPGISPTPSGSGTPNSQGSPTSLKFSITNPLKGTDNLGEFVSKLVSALFQLAIPVAVGLIIWGGILYLTSRGNPGQVEKAKTVIKWAVVGLAVIMIGGGFVNLVESILELGGGAESPQQTR